MTASRWNAIYLVTAGSLAAILVALISVVPRTEDGADWFAPLVPGG